MNDINKMLDEHLKKKHSAQREQLHRKKREELYRIEKEDMPKDAIIIPRKNVKSFLFGAITMIAVLTFIGSAFAVFYAGTQQIVSTVATGTAPFSVASTTVVTNLNADLLDGVSASSLQDLPSSWTCTTREGQSSDCGANCQSAATVSCTGNEKLIAGGCCPEITGNCPLTPNYWGTISDGNMHNPVVSVPNGQGWTCVGYSELGIITATAQCCA